MLLITFWMKNIRFAKSDIVIILCNILLLLYRRDKVQSAWIVQEVSYFACCMQTKPGGTSTLKGDFEKNP